MYRSEDDGNTWTAVTTGLPNSTVRSLLATNRDALYAGIIGEGVYVSTDRGDSWTDRSSGLENVPEPYTFDALAIAGGFLFVGTSGDGVYRSADIVTSIATLSEEVPGTFTLDQNYSSSHMH